MHCASCASIIERTLGKTDGVESAIVNYGTEKIKVTFDESKTNPTDLSKKIEPLGYTLAIPESHNMSTHSMSAKDMGMSEDEHAAHLGLNQTKEDKLKEIKALKTLVASAIPLAIFSIFVMSWEILGQYGIVPEMSSTIKELFHHLLPLMATYILFVVGKPYLLGLYRFLRYGKANMDTLIGIGTVAAYLYSFTVSALEDVLKPFVDVEHTYYDVTIVVITFIALGKYLEASSKLKTGDAIEKLLKLQESDHRC
jgi:Cu2+-exporting ATPase/Cu+-exporting ATPase